MGSVYVVFLRSLSFGVKVLKSQSHYQYLRFPNYNDADLSSSLRGDSPLLAPLRKLTLLPIYK